MPQGEAEITACLSSLLYSFSHHSEGVLHGAFHHGHWEGRVCAGNKEPGQLLMPWWDGWSWLGVLVVEDPNSNQAVSLPPPPSG